MGRQVNEAEMLRAARVDMLMAVVRDTVSSLRHASAQLEVELSAAHQTPGREDELTGTLEVLRAENAQLREALDARSVIEQAKGILMARHGCDADSAFAMLTATSRAERRKVRHVAISLVASASRARNVVDLTEAASFASKTPSHGMPITKVVDGTSSSNAG